MSELLRGSSFGFFLASLIAAVGLWPREGWRDEIGTIDYALPIALVLAAVLASFVFLALAWAIDGIAYNRELVVKRSDSGKIRYDHPQGGHDDGVVALALAWQAVIERPRGGGLSSAFVRPLDLGGGYQFGGRPR